MVQYQTWRLPLLSAGHYTTATGRALTGHSQRDTCKSMHWTHAYLYVRTKVCFVLHATRADLDLPNQAQFLINAVIRLNSQIGITRVRGQSRLDILANVQLVPCTVLGHRR